MLPLTENQESTLNRWAANNLGRPQDNSMTFSMGETGLEEGQINHWWTNQASTRLNIEISPGEVALVSEVGVYGSESNDFDLVNVNLPETLDPFENGIQNFEVFPGLGNWSPLERSCYDFHGLPSDLYGCQSQDNRGDGSQQKRLPHSEITSISDNDLVLSIPSSYVNNCVPNRSSGLSYASGRAWETTSTLFSVDKDQAAGPLESCQSFQPYKGINQANITSMSNSQYNLTSDLHKNQFTTRHHNLESIPRQSTRPRRESSTNLYAKKLPDIPQKFIKYSCTICGQTFERKGAKGDWKRHEQTKCEQQKLWYCMLKEPIIQVPDFWSCMLCKYANSDREELINHIIGQHRFQNCWGKPLSKRCHPRKDKLRDHLKKHHSLSKGSTGWEAWHQNLPEKKAWGCGFCGGCFFTWDARLDHIAEHYEKQGLGFAQWSPTNVIKGLLKQPREWDMLTAWKSLVGHNDQSYTWLSDDALILQRKLEYREDTPQNLALEARRLAEKSSHNFVPQTWPLSESHAARLARDVFAESLSKSSGHGDSGNSYGNTCMANTGQLNPGIQRGNFNGFI